MNWRTLAMSSAAAVPLLMGLASCETMSNILDTGGNTGLDRAEDLREEVDRVHTACEESKQQVHDTLVTLHTMVRPDFTGDAVAAFEEFEESIEHADKKSKELHRAAQRMERTAEKTFTQWTEDLEEFTSPSMRAHSEARLGEAQRRFETMAETVDATSAAFDAFNAELWDHARYLEHDFNAASIAVIENELKELARRSVELDSGFDACLEETQTYVEQGALHGQLATPTE